MLYSSKIYAKSVNIPTSIKQKMALSEVKFKNIQNLLKRIEEKRLLTEEDLRSIEKEVYLYALSLKDIVETAAKNANRTPKALVVVEYEMKKHEEKVKGLLSMVKNIKQEIKSGKIIPEKRLLEKMSPAEREKFLKSLTPQGLKRIKMIYPGLFRKRISLFYIFEILLAPKCAQAKIIEPCLSACEGSTTENITEPCRECAEEHAIIPKALAAWNSFLKCSKNCGSGNCLEWGCVICKFQCLLALVYTLA